MEKHITYKFLFQTTDILYYEVLDIPLPELQGLKTLKVAFHHATKDEVSEDRNRIINYLICQEFCLLEALLCCQVVVHTIRLPKQSTVGDVIDDLKTKVITLQLFTLRQSMDAIMDMKQVS